MANSTSKTAGTTSKAARSGSKVLSACIAKTSAENEPKGSHLSVPSDNYETPLKYLNYLIHLIFNSFGRRFSPARGGHER